MTTENTTAQNIQDDYLILREEYLRLRERYSNLCWEKGMHTDEAQSLRDEAHACRQKIKDRVAALHMLNAPLTLPWPPLPDERPQESPA